MEQSKISVCLLGEGWAQCVGARLDRLCSRRALDFEGAQRACTVVQLGQREDVDVFCKCRRESVDSTRAPIRSVQREMYQADVVGEGSFQRRRK